MNKSLLSLLAIIICLVLFFGVNIAGSATLRGARLDLTDGHLYTLSTGSRAIAKKLDEPIRLTLYLSEKQTDTIPEIKAYATRVREFLREFVNASGGKIKLSIVNPEPFSEAEDEATQAGIQAMQTGRFGEHLYFGLVGINATDKKEIIPFFDSRKEEFLEYDLTRLIYLLSNPAKKAVGIMASLPINGMQNNPMMRGQDVPPWQIVAQMKELFDVQNIAPDAAEIPATISVLMIVHPKNLSDKTQFTIDQYVLKGGRVIVFVDPWCESDVPPGINPMQAMQIPKGSSLTKLFDAWGIEMLPERFAADRDAAIRLPAGPQNRSEMVDYLQYMALTKDHHNFNTSDSVTGQLEKVHMDIAGVLNKKPDATIEFEPLLTTGPNSQTMDIKSVQFMPDPKALLTQFQRGDKPLTVAARLTGKIKTAFPAGDPAKPAPTEGQPPAPDTSLKESSSDANIIVVADCDMLADRFWVQEARIGNMLLGYNKFADNGDFVIGAVDNLSGSSDLISLRARGKFSRPFSRVETIQKAAEDKFLAKQKELEESRQKTEAKISEMLRQAPQGGSVILTPEQQADLDKSRKDLVAIRHQLRDVQHQLRKDIDSLGKTLEFLNVGLMPLAVGVLAVGLSVYRVNRRRSIKAAPVGRS